ncbi:MAG: thioredoxin [Candidatus Azobacteroides sp.]|nr:thioredoxin [Candidatus Azobacteroides sp.]
MVLKITDANFTELVKGNKPLVIDFWAEWCGPCRMIGPFIEELAKEYADKVVIGKMNVDENDEVVAQFGVRNIPTVLFFKHGELVDKQVGAAQKSALEEKVKALI